MTVGRKVALALVMTCGAALTAEEIVRWNH